jgi:hypothetical protein
MKKVVVAIMFAIMLFATMATSYAERGDWHGGIRSRIHEDQQRIERGIERGSLTRHEARRLQRELGDILDKIDRMKEDGRLDRRERERIDRYLDRLDMDITREKRDDERRRY